MNARILYSLWAPGPSPDAPGWSRWASPVLFAHLDPASLNSPSSEALSWPQIGWAPRPDENTLLILDLPGPLAISSGMALAQRGFRPVPIFNGCPAPPAFGGRVSIDLRPLMEALVHASHALRSLDLPPSAPPAFLLDAHRMTGPSRPAPGTFDNRWRVLPEDFPSANFLLASGIRRVLLVQNSEVQPADDLAHVLYRWQRAGIEIAGKRIQDADPAKTIAVKRPRRFRFWWYSVLVRMGLRRNSAGGFGAIVPEETSRSG